MLPPTDQLLRLSPPQLITELKRVDVRCDSLMVERDQLLVLRDHLLVERADLITQVEQLKAQLRAAEKEGVKRSANPFSKQKQKPDPKKPGRKPGQGKFTNRQPPEPQPGDEVVELQAPLESPNCPQCGKPLEMSVEEPTTIDIPETPRRVIKKFKREVGFCPHCDKRFLGHHPELPANQTGACMHRVGPNVMYQTMWQHFCLGVSLHRSVAITRQSTGIDLTQSGVTQAAQKLCAPGAPLAEAYDDLQAQLRQSKVVNTDDTGWAIGVNIAWLMGFFTATICFYAIRNRHRSDELLDILGLFRGLLGCDGGPSYDAKKMDGIEMQKCLSHILKNIKQAMEGKEGEALKFGNGLSALLKEAIELWKEYKARDIKLEEYRRRGDELRAKLTEHLLQRELEDADAQRILDGVGRRHDNGQLVLFLEKPQIEPTNNSAERGLRGAVISRKNSQCSKNEKGALTFAMCKTVFETIRVRGLPVIEAFKKVIESGFVPWGKR
jgi:transposase